MSDSHPVYTLAIKFLSNERPYSTLYTLDHPEPEDDNDAVNRALGMGLTMGREYAVVLLKDGQQMDLSHT